MQMKSRLLELIEKDPKKIDGLRFHASLNTLYYTQNTIKLLPNGRFCIEERSQYDEWDCEEKIINYSDGKVFINNPRIECLYAAASQLFEGKKVQKYVVHKKSGYDSELLAEILSRPEVRIISWPI